jgi:hypothetical protein
VSAFIITYALRFQTGLIPIPKGIPPLRQYINMLPFIAVCVPLGFHLQGLYRCGGPHPRRRFLRRFVGIDSRVVFGIVSTL